MSDLVSRKKVMAALEKVERVHPYKVWGDRDSYSPYNEGWSDAVCLMEHDLVLLPDAPETVKVENIHEEYSLEGICFLTYGDCERCGATVQLGDKFCCECGAKLEWK